MLNYERQFLAGWRRFLAPYYLYNALLLISYVLTRQWWLLHGDPKYSRLSGASSLFLKERYAFGSLAAAIAIKFWRRQSMDAFLSDALTFGKSVVGIMVWYMDYRVLTYYVLLFLVFYLLFPQPIFKGPSKVEVFTPASFREQVEDSAAGQDVTWLVEFFAPWAPACIHLEPVVAELSLTYTTDRLRFGKVDASRWPQLAKQHRVEVYSAVPHLPSFIMFRAGKELGRIPHIYEDGTVAAGKFRREDIVTAFALDEFLEEAKEKEAKKGSGAAAGGSSRAGGGSAKKRR